MTLSLVLLAGALSILYSSKVTYSENDRIARLQEAGRTVVEADLARRARHRVPRLRPPVKRDEILIERAREPEHAAVEPGASRSTATTPSAAAFTPALDAAIVPGADPTTAT